MKCRDLKFDIQQYADGELAVDRSNAVAAHLDSCPLCRTRLDTIRSLKNDLGSLRRNKISLGSLNDIRSIIASEFTNTTGYPVFRLIEGREKWSQKWMWPTAVGTVTSLVFGLLLLSVILIPADVPQLTISTDEPAVSDNSLFLASIGNSSEQLLSARQFASSRSEISQESPSLNPTGTLVDVAGSEARDDEAVVVADVYGNGSAQITDVVESPRDRAMMNRLIAAFRPDRSAPPFVPASFDNRENIVRVVLKFQNVNVNIDEDPSVP